MSQTSIPSSSARLLPDMVNSAIDTIVMVMSLSSAAKRQLRQTVHELARPAEKLPYVSFYAASTRGGINYRVTYRVPGYPIRTERLGKMEKPARKRAQRISEILQQVKARLMKPADAYRELYVDNSPVDKHVTSFESALRSRGVNADYLASTITRLNRCMQMGDYQRLSDITLASIPKLTEALQAFVEPGKNTKLSATTINQYLAALRQFTKWATPSLLAVDPLVNSTGIKNVDQGKRRDILVEELAAIVEIARSGSFKCKMPGEDRAMLYLTAYATGLRRNELRLTQIPWIKFDAKPPYIALPAKVTKNNRDAQQPLPGWLASAIRSWLGDRKTGPLWTYMPTNVAGMFERDRAAARQAWIEAVPEGTSREEREASDFLKRETSDGEIVFHSHRHGYASALVGSGMDLKSAQALTRHATASILADRYAHSRRDKATAGLEAAIKNPMTPTVAPVPTDGAAKNQETKEQGG